MKSTNLTIEIPAKLHEQLQQIATASGQSLEDVVIQSIRMGMPPSLRQIPPQFHAQLLELNQLGDVELLKIIDAKDEPDEDAEDIQTLRRAYAHSLLKWRGHPVPNPLG
ncbi:MAG: hypothetical protein AAF633_21785 [Chloroflexota bacterium]